MNFFSFFGKKKQAAQEYPDHYFRLKNGKILKTMQELVDYLPAITPEEFAEHVSAGKNDFAQWIGDVFHDLKLAELVKKAKNQHSMRLIISHHLMNQQSEKFHSSVKHLRGAKNKEDGMAKKPKDFFDYAGRDLKGLIAVLEVFDKQKFKTYVAYKENRKAVLDWVNSFLSHPLISVQADRDVLVQILKEQLVKPLRDELGELKSEVSRIRKAGVDPVIAELKLLRIPPKIQMAAVTFDDKELNEVKNLIHDAKAELAVCRSLIPIRGQEVEKPSFLTQKESLPKGEALSSFAKEISKKKKEPLATRVKQKLKGMKS